MVEYSASKETSNACATLFPQQRALKEIAASQLRFAVLREPSCWKDAGDVDIIVSDIFEADRTLMQLGYLRLPTQPSNRKHVKYDWIAEQWIHMDVQSTICFGAIEAPPQFVEELLVKSILSDEGIPHICPFDEAILLIFHSALDKGYLNPKYTEHIFRCDRSSMVACVDRYSFLPKPLSEYLNLIEAFQKGKITEQVAINKIRSSFDLRSLSRPPLWKRVYRRARFLIKGNPAVVFLGPDGSGKSSLTEPIAKLLWPPIRRQFMGPARESEMRWVFQIVMNAASCLKKRYSKKNPMGIISRAVWQMVCYFDFWDRLLRHWYFWGSRGVVVFDRYACDMFFRKPTAWNEFLFLKMFPKPRYVYLCVGDAQVIHHRKPELLPDEVTYTIEMYRKKLAQYGIAYIEINTTQLTPEENLTQVVHHLIEHDWFRNAY